MTDVDVLLPPPKSHAVVPEEFFQIVATDMVVTSDVRTTHVAIYGRPLLEVPGVSRVQLYPMQYDTLAAHATYVPDAKSLCISGMWQAIFMEQGHDRPPVVYWMLKRHVPRSRMQEALLSSVAHAQYGNALMRHYQSLEL